MAASLPPSIPPFPLSLFLCVPFHLISPNKNKNHSFFYLLIDYLDNNTAPLLSVITSANIYRMARKRASAVTPPKRKRPRPTIAQHSNCSVPAPSPTLKTGRGYTPKRALRPGEGAARILEELRRPTAWLGQGFSARCR